MQLSILSIVLALSWAQATPTGGLSDKNTLEAKFDITICGENTLYTETQCIVPAQNVTVSTISLPMGHGPVCINWQAQEKKKNTEEPKCPEGVCGSGTKCGWEKAGCSYVPRCTAINPNIVTVEKTKAISGAIFKSL